MYLYLDNGIDNNEVSIIDEIIIDESINQSYEKSSTSISLRMNDNMNTNIRTYTDWIFFMTYSIEEMNNEMNIKSATLRFRENVPKEVCESRPDEIVLAIIQPKNENKRNIFSPKSPKPSTKVEIKPLETESLDR